MQNKKSIYIAVFAVISIIFLLHLLPNIYLKLGVNEIGKQNYIKAYTYLTQAYKIAPNNKDIRYNYVIALSNLAPSIRVQKELFDISNSKEKDSAQSLANIRLNQLRNFFVRDMTDNYIEQAANEIGVIRWDISSFPLKIYIDNSNVNVPDYYKVEIFKALKLWAQLTNFIKFEVLDNIKDSNIIIKISPLPNNVCEGKTCKYVVGITEPEISNGILNKMNITLYEKDPYGNYFSDREIFNTILHEMGHALGIMGHSYNPNDTMYASVKESYVHSYMGEFQYLTVADKNTMLLLYRLLPDISNIPINKIKKSGLIYPPLLMGNEEQLTDKKIKEAKNYIKNAPNLPSGYIDLASAYARKGDYTLALKTLEKGITVATRNEDKYIIYYNSALICINNKDWKKARYYINYARLIENNPELGKLENMIKN